MLIQETSKAKHALSVTCDLQVMSLRNHLGPFAPFATAL